MIKQLMAVLVLIFLVTQIITAKPDSVIVGLYKVSFDLNIKENYNISTSGPRYGETLDENTPLREYFLILNTNKSIAVISLARYDKLMYTKNNTDVKMIKDIFASACGDHRIRTVNKKIDGHNGLLSISNDCNPKDFRLMGNTMYSANYWIDEIDNYGHIICIIMSSFPWDDGTLSLLKTIHVEEVKANSSQ